MSRSAYLGRFANTHKGTSKARVVHGKVKPPEKLNYVAEGSSITLGAIYTGNATLTVPSYATQLGARNYASINSLVANSIARDSLYSNNVPSGSLFTYLPEDDLYVSSNTGLGAYLDSLAGYLDSMRSVGYFVTVLTTLPRYDLWGVQDPDASWKNVPWNNQWRDWQNASLRTWATNGQHMDSLCDFGALDAMGDTSNNELYQVYDGNFIQCANGSWAPITSNTTFSNAPSILPTANGHAILRDTLRDHWAGLGIRI